MLKHGCTTPNTAIMCLHKYTHTKFYRTTEAEKDLLEKIREGDFGGSFIVFTRKAVVDETFIRNTANICKSINGIDPSQV